MTASPTVTLHRPESTRLRAARRRLDEHGEVDAAVLGETLARSWRRSLDAGLPPHGRAGAGPHASAPQLERARQRSHVLIEQAAPLLDALLPAVQSGNGLLLLADADGVVLHAAGDDRFADRAQRVALRPGARWSEALRGTNAIGTALAETRPVVVHGAEHYLARNGFLSCCAAPVFDPAGALAGVVDLTGDQRGQGGRALAHALGLATLAARLLTQRLFDTLPLGLWRIGLHERRDALGTPAQGRMAVHEDGTLAGADPQARVQLGEPGLALGLSLPQRLGLEPARLRALADAAEPQPLLLPDGRLMWVQVQRPAAPTVVVPAAPLRPAPRPAAPAARAEPADAQVLAPGDATLQAQIARAQRLAGRGIGLVLQGESGSGKEVLARALHRSGPRRDGRFVVLSGASLPASLVEAELFGHVDGAFTGARAEGRAGRVREADGGTLFIDDVTELPAPAQAALLRVLQDRAVLPLGAADAVAVDFDLTCATREPLRDAVDAGRLRADLYHRLAGLTLVLPPLRARSDRGALLQQLLAAAGGAAPRRLSAPLAAAVDRYPWPGNLRQLAQALRTACALADDDEALDFQHLGDDLAEALRAA
ncbi:MAG: sigma 54-interacting transcriptional regulator [Rubrivivax sp.]